MPRLTTPRIRVLMTDPDLPEDEGAEFYVRALNADMVAFDRDRPRYGWPTADQAPFVWLTYLAWKGLTRTGQIPACTLAEFEGRCLSVESSDPAADPGSGVDPTPAVAGPA